MKLYGPFHDCHALAGARFFDWGGWQLPLACTSARDEVAMVRTRAGFTDFPFLAHLMVDGAEALPALQTVCSRNLEACARGRGLYTLMLNGDGGVAEDGMVFRLDRDRFLVTVPGPNPGTLPPDIGFFGMRDPKPWLLRLRGPGVSIHPLGVAVLSVQGPLSGEMLRPVLNIDEFPLRAIHEVTVGAVPALCARTGFSGEAGVEFFIWPEYAAELWETVTALGRKVGAAPYGIEAAMILGLEKGYLNANDFYPGSTPVELGLDWLVALDKPRLAGREAILRRRREGPRTILAGLEAPVGGPPFRTGQTLTCAGEMVGRVTNGGLSPTLGMHIARAWMPAALAVPGTEVTVRDGEALFHATVAAGYRWHDPENRRLRACPLKVREG